jgi:virginiamycin B lyase
MIKGLSLAAAGALVMAGGIGVAIAPAASASDRGTVTFYTNSSIDEPVAITADPGGDLWFTNYGSNTVEQITTTGAVTNYTGKTISSPCGIAEGADGALWFANSANNSIGRITS